MPSESGAQHRFMALCANDPEDATKKCPPKSVAKEFVHADKGKKFARGSAQSEALRRMVMRR